MFESRLSLLLAFNSRLFLCAAVQSNSKCLEVVCALCFMGHAVNHPNKVMALDGSQTSFSILIWHWFPSITFYTNLVRLSALQKYFETVSGLICNDHMRNIKVFLTWIGFLVQIESIV